MFKGKLPLIFIFSAIVLAAAFFWIQGNVFHEGQKVVGVQLISSKGTVLVGRNRFTHELAIYRSPLQGWFDSKGDGRFFEVKTKREKLSKPNWEIVWEWDELYKVGDRDALIKNAPLPEDREAAIETLRSLCKKSEEQSYSCNWNISKKIQLEGFTKDYLCVVQSSGEFYGGAHPIAQRSFRTFDWRKKTILSLEDLIPESEAQEKIWSQLNSNIRDFESQDLSQGQPDDAIVPVSQDYGSSLILSDQSSEDRLSATLSDRGYAFQKDALCPIIRTDGPYLLFGFPHSEQVNRGLNYRAEILLEEKQTLPTRLKRLYSDYQPHKPTSDVSVYLDSPDGKWHITQKLNQIEVIHQNNKLALLLPELKDENSEDLLGIFWIYTSPTPSQLESFQFKNIPSPLKGKSLNLAKYLR